MPTNTDKVTLGNGQLLFNGVDIGHVKGTAEFSYTLDSVGFKPATMLGDVKRFKIREGARLRITFAELSVANVKVAMGIDSVIDGSTSFPLEEGSWSFSYDEPNNADSYDVMTFGGDKTTIERSMRFTHTRPDGKTFHIIFYKAIIVGQFTLPFNEEDVTLADMEFEALADEDRAQGDQVGVFVEQVVDA